MRTAIFQRPDITFSQDLTVAGGTALSYTTTVSRPFTLTEINIHASEAITETITITKIPATGANYGGIFRKRAISAEQDFVFHPTSDMKDFQAGDKIKVECTAANVTGIVYGTIKTREI